MEEGQANSDSNSSDINNSNDVNNDNNSSSETSGDNNNVSDNNSDNNNNNNINHEDANDNISVVQDNTATTTSSSTSNANSVPATATNTSPAAPAPPHRVFDPEKLKSKFIIRSFSGPSTTATTANGSTAAPSVDANNNQNSGSSTPIVTVDPKKFEDLKTAYGSLYERYSVLAGAFAALGNLSKGACNEKEELERHFEDVKADLSRVEGERDEANKKIKELEEEAIKLRIDLMEIPKLTAKIEELTSDSSEKEDKHKKAEKVAQEKLNVLKKNFKDLRASEATTKQKNEELKAQIEQLNLNIQKQQQEIDKLTKDLTQNQESAAAQNAKFVSRAEAIAKEKQELEKVRDELHSQCEEYQGKIDGLVAEVEKLKGESQSQQKHIQLQQSTQEKDRSILQDQLEQLKAENDKLKENEKTMNEVIAQNMGEIETLNQKLLEYGISDSPRRESVSAVSDVRDVDNFRDLFGRPPSENLIIREVCSIVFGDGKQASGCFYVSTDTVAFTNKEKTVKHQAKIRDIIKITRMKKVLQRSLIIRFQNSNQWTISGLKSRRAVMNAFQDQSKKMGHRIVLVEE